VCASHPSIRSQRRFRKAFPPCFTGVYEWDICAKNWQLSSLRAPVALLRDQSLVPAQKRVWRGDSRDVLEALAPERVCERGKAALGISQAQPAATELGFEHAIFLLKVGDNRLIGTTQTG
jgi:hypothetical protein